MTAIFAHRGFTGTPGDASRPVENTVEAFAAAHSAGADGVELDVRLTADAELAVRHDRQLPGVGPLTNIPARDLPPDVPLLAGALVACTPLAVNVELKHEAPDRARRLAVEVARLLSADGRPEVFVSSFDAESLRRVRRQAPGVRTGLLVDWATDARAALRQAVSLGCSTLHPFVTQVDRDLVEAARAAGIGLHVWTVNAQDDLAEMGRLEVEAVITDRVPAALAVLRGARLRNGGDGAG